MQNGKITVVVGEKNMFIRTGIVILLNKMPRISVVGEAGEIESLLSEELRTKAQVVVTDILDNFHSMAVFVGKCKTEAPYAKILVFSECSDYEIVSRLTIEGIDGYLLRNSRESQLSEYIEAVIDNFMPMDPRVTKPLIVGFIEQTRNVKESILTQRQISILKEITKGTHAGDIGKNLFISQSSVKREIRNIFDRLGVEDRITAVLQAKEKGLI